jgi:hypothetical protein
MDVNVISKLAKLVVVLVILSAIEFQYLAFNNIVKIVTKVNIRIEINLKIP